MPKIDCVVVETTKQILEPVSEQIARRLFSVLGFDDIFKDNIYIVSDDLKSSKFEDEDDHKRAQGNRCDIEIVPGYNPIETAFDAVRSRDFDVNLSSNRGVFSDYPVFSDPRSEINLFELGVPCSIELKFSIRVKSIELSDHINTVLYSRYLAGGSVYDYNDIQFSYALPDIFIVLLYKMYKMQHDVVTKMTFQEYLSIGSNTGITTLVNRERLDGDLELVMQRINTKVLGRLNYEGDKHETEDFNKVSNRYLIQFSYVYQFTKPSLLQIHYPVMINNQLIANQFVGKPQNMNYGEGPQIHPDRGINVGLYTHNKAQIDLDRTYPEIRYPWYDDWLRSPRMYADLVNKYQILFCGLMAVDVDETTSELSLSIDLEQEVFPLLSAEAVDELKRVIERFHFDKSYIQLNDDLFRRLGIFDIAVFCNDAIVPFDKLSLSSDYVLSVNISLDISKRYRFIISQIREVRILNRVYIYYILEYPEYYAAFIAFHAQYLAENGFVDITTDPITKKQMVRMHRPFVQNNYGQLTPQSIDVGNYIIDVRRAHM